jgi:hypothetical protein
MVTNTFGNKSSKTLKSLTNVEGFKWDAYKWSL